MKQFDEQTGMIVASTRAAPRDDGAAEPVVIRDCARFPLIIIFMWLAVLTTWLVVVSFR